MKIEFTWVEKYRLIQVLTEKILSEERRLKEAHGKMSVELGYMVVCDYKNLIKKIKESMD
jgi:hypothetical protein